MKYLSPRYWLLWFIILLLRIVCWLPYRVLMQIGAGVGDLIRHFSSRARAVTQKNLELCYPQLTPAERTDLLKANFRSVGMSIFETVLAYCASDKKLKKLVNIQGLDYLKAAIEQGKGVLVLGAHFTTLQLIGRLLSADLNFAVVFRRQKNPILDFFTLRLVQKYYRKAIPRGDVRGILRALKEKMVIWYTPDIDAGRKNSIFAPFFGVMAASITATPRLVKISGAPILLCAYYRRDDLSGYDVIIESELDNFPSGDVVADVTRINLAQEQMIRKKPEQYLWQYKRFKTRPPGEAKLY